MILKLLICGRKNKVALRRQISSKKELKTMVVDRGVAEKWKQLSGESHWEGLLDPLNMDLRIYIIHCGEMAQATYDCFNSQKNSKHAGNTMYGMRNFFSHVGLEKGNSFKYSVTKFFYATSSIDLPEGFLVRSLSREAWSKESNWMGYVAVATDEGRAVLGRRDIVVAWRGTIQAMEWANDFQFNLVSAKEILGGAGSGEPKVHHGWLSLYTSTDARSPFNTTSARDQVIKEVRRLVKLYEDEEVSVTVVGHSLGGALATLNAVDIVANGFNKVRSSPGKEFPVAAFVFACPRVGDQEFLRLCSRLNGLRVLRVRNRPDVVPLYPPILYSDVGEELLIDNSKSEYLKSTGSLRGCHNMEGYLHGVAGTQGMKEKFKLEVERSVSLVNKSIDWLKDEYLVPPSWRTLKDKGIVQMDDGSWKLEDYYEE